MIYTHIRGAAAGGLHPYMPRQCLNLFYVLHVTRSKRRNSWICNSWKLRALTGHAPRATLHAVRDRPVDALCAYLRPLSPYAAYAGPYSPYAAYRAPSTPLISYAPGIGPLSPCAAYRAPSTPLSPCAARRIKRPKAQTPSPSSKGGIPQNWRVWSVEE
jgi:hypothetical protein